MISSHYDSSDEEAAAEDNSSTSTSTSPLVSSFTSSPDSNIQLVPSSTSNPTDALTYDIVVDGEVVGTTQLPIAPSPPPFPSPLPPIPSIDSSLSSPSPPPCSTCGATPSKYRCPCCSTPSCSLPCVSSHKSTTQCTGKRPRSTFVPLPSFTSTQLQHDLFFLEEVGRQTATSLRHPLVKRIARDVRDRAGEEGEGGQVVAFASGGVSGRFVALQRECARRGVRVMVMPEGMRRHQQNSSVYQARTGELLWRVEWLLDRERLLLHSNAVRGSLTWRAALANLLCPSPSASTERRSRQGRSPPLVNRPSAEAAATPVEERKESDEGATAEQPLRLVARHADVKVRQQLQAYADALDELQLFMRVPMTAANTVVYYTIPVTSTINDSLKGLTVIEFPTVHVVFPSDAAAYVDHRSPCAEAQQQLPPSFATQPIACSISLLPSTPQTQSGRPRDSSERVAPPPVRGQDSSSGALRGDRGDADDPALFKRWT